MRILSSSRFSLKTRRILQLLVCACVYLTVNHTFFPLQQLLLLHQDHHAEPAVRLEGGVPVLEPAASTATTATTTTTGNNNIIIKEDNTVSSSSSGGRCAINLYGLPRSFKDLVLPSLVKHVIRTNAPYNCDYFIHYYNVTLEEKGKSGQGGQINPHDILDVQSHIVDAAANNNNNNPNNNSSSSSNSSFLRRQPTIAFKSHTDKEFWDRRNETLQKVRNTKDSNGRYYYFPWRETMYRHPQTTDNIIKMWHSIDAAWTMMKENEQAQNIRYDRVAMLRSDLVYMTPLDIYSKANGQRDEDNNVVVIPNFAKHPVNDRSVYGPAEAVKVWAVERFDRMEDFVNRSFHEEPGYGLQSERFVARLLSIIRERNFQVEEHPILCMYRARADKTVWHKDCGETAKRLERTIQSKLSALLEMNCSVLAIKSVPRRVMKCEKK